MLGEVRTGPPEVLPKKADLGAREAWALSTAQDAEIEKGLAKAVSLATPKKVRKSTWWRATGRPGSHRLFPHGRFLEDAGEYRTCERFWAELAGASPPRSVRSTVHGAEQKAALAKVLRLVDHRRAPANTVRGEGPRQVVRIKKKAG